MPTITPTEILITFGIIALVLIAGIWPEKPKKKPNDPIKPKWWR